LKAPFHNADSYHVNRDPPRILLKKTLRIKLAFVNRWHFVQ